VSETPCRTERRPGDCNQLQSRVVLKQLRKRCWRDALIGDLHRHADKLAARRSFLDAPDDRKLAVRHDTDEQRSTFI